MPERFTETLRTASEAGWSLAMQHRFVNELIAGAVPDAVMARYLRAGGPRNADRVRGRAVGRARRAYRRRNRLLHSDPRAYGRRHRAGHGIEYDPGLATRLAVNFAGQPNVCAAQGDCTR